MAMMSIDILHRMFPTYDIVRYDNQTQRAIRRDGHQLAVWTYVQPGQAATAVAALNLRNGDSVVPALHGADRAGQLCGTPFVVTDAPVGELLATIATALSAEQIYAIGQQLGQIVATWHTVTFTGFGALGDTQHSIHEVVQTRIQHAGAGLQQARIVSTKTFAAHVPLLEALYHVPSQTPVLVHSAISPASVWLTRSGTRWHVQHITAWHAAHAGVASAEHVYVQHHFDGEAWFALRVGYGEAYDEHTPKAGMQVRERALRGERVLCTLEQAAEAARHGDHTRAHTLWGYVRHWCATFEPETTFSATEENA